MRNKIILLLVSLVLVSAAAVVATGPPVTVSPGTPSKLAPVEARCPTFSWGEVEGATAYELVVVRVDEEGATADEVLWQTFPGSVESWTPPFDRRLERGGRYAWSIRAIGAEETSEWSAPALFEVAAPTVGEFEEALAVVRSYLARRESSNPVLEGPRPTVGIGTANGANPLDRRALRVPFRAPGSPPQAFPSEVGTSLLAESKMGSFAAAAVSGELKIGQPGWAVFGVAGSGTGVKGAAGGATVGWRGETGVWGVADALAVNSTPVGVLGEAYHTLGGKGFGGLFYSNSPGGVAVAAVAKRDVDLALVVDSLDGDDGLIGSEPSEPSSDIILVSNDAVAVRLDQDGDGEDADFEVSTTSGVIFNVDETGTIRLTPTDAPDSCGAGTAGSLYYDTSIGDFCVCRGTKWTQLAGGADC